MIRIALAGNPNSGKTTLYNALTGANEKVGNWSGVTVASKISPLKTKFYKEDEIRIIDLPGAYSISPHTQEEAITSDFVKQENPDVIINIVDGANLERSLYFTTQLMELGIPMVVALNKADIIEKREEIIDIPVMKDLLQIPVIATTATKENGLKELVEEAVKQKGTQAPKPVFVSGSSEFETQQKERQTYIKDVAQRIYQQKKDLSSETTSDKIDQVVAHPILGIPIFFLVMWAVYYISMQSVGDSLAGWVNDVLFGEIVPNAANGFFESIGTAPMLQAVIVDGAIAGVGAVLGFLPLIMVLFFLLALLEDSGYMARVALIMDRYFKKIGLSGKSIIPMIVGSGCAIPGVMATRTIEDINERRMTTILTPFVPCGAKLPIIGMIAAAFFPGNAWIFPSAYLLAFVVIFFSGLLLKKIFAWENTTNFILELPEYKLPSLKYAIYQMFDKAKSFVKKATTIILVMSTLVWFMGNYTPSFQQAEQAENSMLASVGHAIEPILTPLGFQGWQLPAAAVSGFIAKEAVVSTLEVVSGAADAAPVEDATEAGPTAVDMTEEEVDEFELATNNMMETGKIYDIFGGTGVFGAIVAYAYLVFNLFTPPCFAAIGAMNSEMGSKKWLLRGVLFQLMIGYFLAMLVTQIGSLVLLGKPAPGFVASIIITIGYAGLVYYLIKRADKTRHQMEMELASAHQ